MPSNQTNKAVVCPSCGELAKADIYTSVNVTNHPDMRDKVLEESCSRGAVRHAAIRRGSPTLFSTMI